jgi:hypothetical protein
MIAAIITAIIFFEFAYHIHLISISIFAQDLWLVRWIHSKFET